MRERENIYTHTGTQKRERKEEMQACWWCVEESFNINVNNRKAKLGCVKAKSGKYPIRIN